MLDSYKIRMTALGSYEGESRRRNSQKIMDASWMRDASTKPVYVKWCDQGTPIVDDDDEILYAKYNVKQYYSVSGDEIPYLLQFRLEDMQNRPDIKVGSYVYIPNETNIYEWWMIVNIDDRPMFRQCMILKCLHTYKWATFQNGHRVVHECLGAPRLQSSYNSGVWLDYYVQVIEQQHVMILPNNDDTRTIMYDQRFLLGDEKRYPPLAYKISKVSPSMNGDIVQFTMTQEQYSTALDNFELMIGGYYSSTITPELPELEEIPAISDLEITCSGKPAVRAGGGYKKFSLKARTDGKLVDATDDIEWIVDFPDGDLKQLETSEAGNVFKVKCKPDYSLIGKTFTITAKTKYSSKTIIAEVTSL